MLPSDLEESCQAEKDGKWKPSPASAPLLGVGGSLVLCGLWFTSPVWPAVAPPPPPAHTSSEPRKRWPALSKPKVLSTRTSFLVHRQDVGVEARNQQKGAQNLYSSRPTPGCFATQLPDTVELLPIAATQAWTPHSGEAGLYLPSFSSAAGDPQATPQGNQCHVSGKLRRTPRHPWFFFGFLGVFVFFFFFLAAGP